MAPTQNPVDFAIDKAKLEFVLSMYNYETFEISIDNDEFTFSRTVNRERGQSYAFNCTPSNNWKGVILQSLFEGKPVTVTKDNAEFIKKVARTLDIPELGEIADDLCMCEEENHQSKWWKWTKNKVNTIFSSFSPFGKFLFTLWDLVGVTFILAFYINMIVMISTTAVRNIVEQTYIFIFILLPLLLFSFFYINLALIAISEFLSFRIFRSITIFENVQKNIILLIKMSNCGVRVKRTYIFTLTKYINGLYGFLFFIAAIFSVLQLLVPAIAEILRYFLLIFVLIVPISKYVAILLVYSIHACFSISTTKCKKFIELGDFSDPFLNAFYTRHHPYASLFQNFSLKPKKTDEMDNLDSYSSDDFDQPLNPNKEDLSLKKSNTRLVTEALFSRQTFAFYVYVSLVLYNYVTLGISGTWMLVIFITLTVPLCSAIDLPFFWIWRFVKSLMTTRQLEISRELLHKTNNHYKQNRLELIWSKKYNKIRWSSLVCNVVHVFIIVIAAIALSSTYEIIRINEEAKVTSTSLYTDSIYNTSRTSYSTVCNAHSLGLTLKESIALSYASYYKNESDPKFYEIIQEYFGEDWKTQLKVISTDFNNSTNGYMRHFEIPSRNLTIFGFRGTDTGVDALADMELWFGAFVTDFVAPFIIGVDIYEDFYWKVYGTLISIPRYLFGRFSIIDGYIQEMDNYISEASIPENHKVLMVGHSLGGGLAKILAMKYNVVAISLSGPGISSAKVYYGGLNKGYIESGFINMIPDHDWVAKIDKKSGTTFQIPCRVGHTNCHSSIRSICQIEILCGTLSGSKLEFCKKNFNNVQLEEMWNLAADPNVERPF